MDKYELIKYDTPIQKLEYKVGECNIYMKRDDLIGFGGGGNKVRLYEYIASDIIKSTAKKIITFGSIHSNHIRVSAMVANHLEIGCDLILLHEEGESFDSSYMTPNLKMIKCCKRINIVHCRADEAHDFIEDYLAKQNDYYWVAGGGHTQHAIYGYVEVAQRILHKDVKFDAVFLPCGTGTTMAGMIYGMKAQIPVYGITVARSVERCKDVITDLLNLNGYVPNDMEVNVLPCSIHYGERTVEIDEIIGRLLCSDGICLDPIYNAKSFLGMTAYIRQHSELSNILYINTGGQPNIFA